MPTPWRPGEAGSSTVAVVLVLPGLLLVVMAVVQFAFWSHAHHVALAAAQEGVRAARVVDGSADDGRARAAWMLGELGPGLVLEPAIEVEWSAGEVRVEVQGHAPQWLPGVRLGVRAASAGRVEAFRADSP